MFAFLGLPGGSGGSFPQGNDPLAVARLGGELPFGLGRQSPASLPGELPGRQVADARRGPLPRAVPRAAIFRFCLE